MATLAQASTASSEKLPGSQGIVESSVFKPLPPDHLEILMNRGTTIRAVRHQILFCEGETLKHFYFLASGSVKLVRQSEEGKELIVALVGAGGHFGASVQTTESTVVAQSLEPSDIVSIPVATVRRLVSDYPEVGMELLLNHERAHARAATVATELAFESVPKRLALLLLRESNPQTGDIRYPLNQTELANIIGSSRETVCSILNNLRRQNLLEIRRGRVRVIKREGLSEIQ